MSDRRKKDRYNETWTKDELTDSLRGISKKSHRSKDDYPEKKERRRREDDDTDKSRHKSHSKRDEEYDRERRREHRSRKHDEGYDRVDSNRDQSDRRKKRERGDKSDRHREREDIEMNGSDRYERRRDRKEDVEKEKPNRSEKKSSRHRESGNHRYEDDDRHRRSKHSSRREIEDNEYHDKKREDRRYRDEESSSRDHRRHRDHDHRAYAEDDRYDNRSRNDYDHHKRRSKHREGSETSSKDKTRHRSKREEDSEGHSSRYDEERRDRRSRPKEDDDEYRKRKKEERRREKEKKDSERLSKREDDERYERHKRRTEKHKNDHKEYKKESESYGKDSKDEEYKDSKQSGSQGNPKNTVEKDTKAEDIYNYDDDDFEDYDDDFEDDEEESIPTGTDQKNRMGKSGKERDKMDELIQAIAAETERANSAHSSGRFRNSPLSDRNDTPYSQTSSFSTERDYKRSTTEAVTMINFSAAAKSSLSSRAHKKILKRSSDLMNLIQLDPVGFDILDMAPVTEYNLYIKNFGSSNTTQVSVQCNDDNLDQDIQTDIPDYDTKWTQHPPHELKCSGGDEQITEVGLGENDRETILSTLRGDSLRLTRFMTRSSKLIEAILNEDEMWRLSQKDGKQKSSLSFCDAVTSLQTNLPYLQGRTISYITNCQTSAHNLIAVAFKPASNSFSTRIDRKGLVAIWNARKPAIPEKILVCDACPTCCCFGSNKSYLLFVGADDGCVLAYDLREAGVHHQVVSLERTRETVLRSATYSTGHLEDGHCSPIISIMSVGAESSSPEEKLISSETVEWKSQSGLAFQIASLEEASKLSIWVVVEMLPEAVSNDDLGLSPYGRIKLIRSLNFSVPSPIKTAMPGIQSRTTCVQFSLTDPNNFFVGIDTGHIIHCTQFSASNEQSQLSANSKDVFYNEVDSISSVTSIDINPFQLRGASLILAGHEDGCLRLYLSDRKQPVINWLFSTEGASIVKVQWSPTRPSVFFVLDSNHNLHIWDLAIMHAGPIKTEYSDKKHLKTFSLSNGTANRGPEIALAYKEGSGNDHSIVELHQLAPHFSQVTDYQELDQLTFLVQSLL